MKQTLSLEPSLAPLGLSAWHSGSPIVITGTIPAYPQMRAWYMQLWRYPHSDEPVATAVGGTSLGTVTFTFTAAQTAIASLSDIIGTNNYFITIGGTDTANQKHVARAGVIEICKIPFVLTADVLPVGFEVHDDVLHYRYDGVLYVLPMALISPVPDGAAEGEWSVIHDTFVVTFNGVSYSCPVSEEDPAPLEAVEGELVVVDDTLIITTGGASYITAVSPVIE